MNHDEKYIKHHKKSKTFSIKKSNKDIDQKIKTFNLNLKPLPFITLKHPANFIIYLIEILSSPLLLMVKANCQYLKSYGFPGAQPPCKDFYIA